MAKKVPALRKTIVRYADRLWRFEVVDTEDIDDGVIFVRYYQVDDERA